MDNESKIILKIVGIDFHNLEDTNGTMILRDNLLSDMKYEMIKVLIPKLKNHYSSTFMTCLQKNADKLQKWPLLNLVRQILNVYKFKMVPIRKSDGYTLNGIKKYKRYFQIEPNKNSNTNNNKNIKKIELNNFEEINDIHENEHNEI